VSDSRAWSGNGRKICFNTAPDKGRQRFVADLSRLMEGVKT